ncbi:MAG: bifunctional glutamine synthetase adenylyltransferase/deadenyltransferase, partial [Pseudomonadota bacterium]
GSDLDIVFLHDSDGEQQETDGERSISNDVFFARLARRLVHFLSVQTSAGKLYEVDIRLRPSGRSGLMVSSIASFRRYQAQDAWTWEHQALLRSRAIAGSGQVSETFEQIRRATLTDSVDRAGLKEEVAKMRERMRKELSRSKPGEFDLKQDPGGLADIEFLVQYQVLQNAKAHPELLVYPDNMRQIDGLLQADLMAKQTGESLQNAYLALRQAIHKRALDSRPAIAPVDDFAELANTVRSAWDEVFT